MPKDGLINSLNLIRELSTELYQRNIPIFTADSDISLLAQPMLEYPTLQNEFINALVNKVVYTAFVTRLFNNPLNDLKGANIPLGYAGEEIYVNPTRGRKYNVNDFAGILVKYEADVKVQYPTVNMDVQYPVSVSRHELKKAFTSWENLDTLIGQLTNSLYNGAYIDEYNFTKELITSAYKNNSIQMMTIQEPNTEALAKTFVAKAREMFLNFSIPSNEYNAWSKVGGYGRPIITWTEPQDIIIFIRTSLRAYLDVNVLATAFNMTSTELMGKIYTVKDFDIHDDEGNVIFDGSNIVGMIADKSWFKIKDQNMWIDEDYNPNNRVWQYYLNKTGMYQYSLFANAMLFVTAEPTVTITGLDYNNTTNVDVAVGESEGLDINVTPFTANSPTIAYSISDSTIATITTDNTNDRHVTVTGVKAGTATLTAKAGNVQTTIQITVA